MLKVIKSWFDRYLAEEEAVLILIFIAFTILVVSLLGSVLIPILFAAILAFVLQGLVNWLMSKNIKEGIAIILSTLMLVGILVTSVLILLPAFWGQLSLFIAEAPNMISKFDVLLSKLPEQYPQVINESMVNELLSNYRRWLADTGQLFLTNSIARIPMLITALVYLILVPILVFFFLKDWRVLFVSISKLLPNKRPMLKQVGHEMSSQISTYIRGKAIEIMVVFAVSTAIFYGINLNYALLLGIMVGLSVLIPYLGATAVTFPVLLIGYLQWGFGDQFLMLAVVYFAIQAIDGNILVPYLFSETLKIHPTIIILAVLVFGGLWGFWGVFFAIPLTTLFKALLNAWPTNSPSTEYT